MIQHCFHLYIFSVVFCDTKHKFTFNLITLAEVILKNTTNKVEYVIEQYTCVVVMRCFPEFIRMKKIQSTRVSPVQEIVSV